MANPWPGKLKLLLILPEMRSFIQRASRGVMRDTLNLVLSAKELTATTLVCQGFVKLLRSNSLIYAPDPESPGAMLSVISPYLLRLRMDV